MSRTSPGSSPRNMASSALAKYDRTTIAATHQSWESALQDVLSVLRIQYRNDDDVMLFLTDSDKLKQLQYSTAAKMEWNRRVIKEEMDSGIHSPPRSRRIAKEVAIDYIRRYLDGEEERMDMLRKIQILTQDKEDTLSTLVDLEKDIKRQKDENFNLTLENSNLKDEIAKTKGSEEITQAANQGFREENANIKAENEDVRFENAKLRDENKKLRNENQDLRNENGALRAENQVVRGDNVKLRDEACSVRDENVEIRKENVSLRGENEEIRCENLKMRDNNTALHGENDRLRTTNEAVLSENKRLVRDNLEYQAREDEMKMLVNVQSSLLATKVGEEKEEDTEAVEAPEEEEA